MEGTGTDRSDGLLAPGDVIDGRYVLVERLGAGGMNEVWSATTRDGGAELAIRVPVAAFATHPDVRQHYERHHDICTALKHPNLIVSDTCGYDEAWSLPYHTMERVHGVTLQEFLQSAPPNGLPIDRAWGLATQAGSALTHMHAQGFVHSDVKPGSFLVDERERLCLGVSGLARRYARPGEAHVDDVQLGALTPTYASPEMFDGQDADPRDDVYGFGIVLYQLFAGVLPYGRRSAPKAAELGLRPPRVPCLSRRQNRVLARAVHLDGKQRTSSVTEVLEGLRRRWWLLEKAPG